MREEVPMELVWVLAAGALLAGVYLAAIEFLLLGGNASRIPLLLAMAGFMGATAGLLGVMFVLADGRFDRLVAALAGFAGARALVGSRLRVLHGPPGRRRGDEVRRLSDQPLDRLA